MLNVKVKVKGHVIRALFCILGMSYSVIDGLVIHLFTVPFIIVLLRIATTCTYYTQSRSADIDAGMTFIVLDFWGDRGGSGVFIQILPMGSKRQAHNVVTARLT